MDIGLAHFLVNGYKKGSAWRFLGFIYKICIFKHDSAAKNL